MKPNVEVEEWYLSEILSGNLTLLGNDFYYKNKLVSCNSLGGYERCTIYPDGWKNPAKAIQKHRLLWMHHHKQLIPNGLLINHENGIKDNNVLDNFQLTTNQQNVQHAFDTGLAKRTSEANIKAVENNPFAVFSNEDVVNYRHLHAQGKITTKTISENHQCSLKTVYDMLNRKTYTHVKE